MPDWSESKEIKNLDTQNFFYLFIKRYLLNKDIFIHVGDTS